MTMADDRTLSIKEFAARCRRSPETVRRWFRAGKLRGAKKPGGRTSRLEIPASCLSRIMGKPRAGG